MNIMKRYLKRKNESRQSLKETEPETETETDSIIVLGDDNEVRKEDVEINTGNGLCIVFIGK